MKTINIFLDDDLRNRKTPNGFIRFTNLEDLIEYMNNLDKGEYVNYLSLDNDLGIGIKEGREAIKEMVENDWAVQNVLVHSANSVAQKYIISSMSSYQRRELTSASCQVISYTNLIRAVGGYSKDN